MRLDIAEAPRSASLSATAWLLRVVGSVPKGLPRVFLSLALFTVPFGLWLMAATVSTPGVALPRSVFLAFSWLCIAPLLIWFGYLHFCRFLDDAAPLLPPSDRAAYREAALSKMLGTGHWLPSLLMAAIIGFFGWYYSRQIDAPASQVWWCTVAFMVLGFVSGIGFWAVATTSVLIRDLCARDIAIDYSHPDKFGGLRFVGTVAAKMTSLFFSGSLLIPFTLDVLETARPANLDLLAYLGLFIFMLVGLLSFLASILQLHDCVFRAKVRLDQASSERLHRMLEESLIGSSVTLASVIKPAIYCYCYHDRIAEMKEYPFESRTLIEIIASVLIPVLVFALDKLVR
jgi:hypothetical protein